ncbi:MAG: hypothetical protein KIH08_15535 [Candidatus Freyarchaeota archaeon]|nr:hypothetical protein [Candidatus Jordarchaeia archaeon]MBS7269700.1 hypothetical protein [Candidatus Jordarchaeia archaeon]MBS7280582.1 hypothetical protein [Candidatus Jordarchaeia archaeon]
MPYGNEKEMYPDIKEWLLNLLKSEYKKYDIKVYDTHAQILSKFLVQKNFHIYFPDFQSYEIKVDITGVIIKGDTAKLAFVECKLRPITLRDISQLIGYSKVANPIKAIILSPEDVSDPVSYLFRTLRRYDILAYNKNKVIIGRWDENRKELITTSIIPKGEIP